MRGPPPERLEAERTAIRAHRHGDLDVLVDLRRRNRAFLEPWDPLRGEHFYTRAGQEQVLSAVVAGWREGTVYSFLVLDRTDADRPVGNVTLNNIVRGAFQNATLGYWIAEDAGGRGHATAAVRLACAFAFEHAALHRVAPAVMPRNARSLAVVRKAGFRHEGLALRYLQIAGAWEDHELFALTAEDWRSA